MIKAVIFDLNGIFLQAPKLGHRLAQDYGVKHEEFLPVLHEVMHKVRQLGAASAFSYWQPHLQKWGINFSEREFFDYWFGAEKVSEQMVTFAKQLRAKGIKVFVLSNNFRERAEYYGHYPWVHEAVDKVYFSFNTGFVKPDVRAWQLILSENNLKPEGCLYFDDKESNLKAAEEIGIRTFHFTKEAELKRIVNGYLT